MLKPMNNLWNPEQYAKFETMRNAPFYDLCTLIQPTPQMTIVDLGCGTGQLTHELHEKFQATSTLGIDTSKEMLAHCQAHHPLSLRFQEKKIEDFANESFAAPYDLIFSNAALQWLPDHEKLFTHLSHRLTKRGQFAFQMPANYDFPTHQIARELALEPSFSPYLGEKLIPSVLQPEEYAEIFYKLGFKKQQVRLQVYGHVLESTASVIEWVKGSLLTYYEGRFSQDIYKLFFLEYKKRVLAALGSHRPYFMPFKRYLLWASRD